MEEETNITGTSFSYSGILSKESHNEEYVRLEETKALHRERQWLLSTEIERVAFTLLPKLCKAENLLQTQSELISFKSPLIMVPGLSTKINKLRGNISIKGLRIHEGEVYTYLITEKKPVTYSAKIVDKNMLSLFGDCQYAANYLTLSISAVRALISRIRQVAEVYEVSGDFDEQTTNKQQQILRDVFLALTNIGKLLTEARKQLEHGTQLELPSSLPHFLSKTSILDKDVSFQPRPPPYIFIDFSIAKCQLCVSTYFLQLSDNRPQRTQKPNSMIGYSYKVQNKWIEVIDHVEAREDIPTIQNVVEMISLSYDLCTSLRNKITAIDSP